MGWHWGILAASGAGAAGAYEHIATVNGTGSSSSVTFSSLSGYSSTYKHFQIRYTVRSTYGFEGFSLGVRLNGVSTSSYTSHRLYGTAGYVASEGFTGSTAMTTYRMPGNTATANSYGAGIIDIIDPFSTSKYTTQRYLGGFHSSGESNVALTSGLYLSTDAVSSITLLDLNSGNFTTASRFSLYGIKG